MVADLSPANPGNGASQPTDGQPSTALGSPKRPNYTGVTLKRTRPRIYAKIVQLLGEGRSMLSISKELRVSQMTLAAVKEREELGISERKNSIIGLLGDTAELGAYRMTETIGKAGIRDAAIGTGVAIDKILALTGQTPPTVGVVVMPNDGDREAMRNVDAKLDEIARRLRLSAAPPLGLPPA